MADREPAQMFQQIMQQMTQGSSGSPPDAFDFTTKPKVVDDAPDVHKGEWITDVTYQSVGSPLLGGVSVASADLSGDTGGVPLGDPITFTYTVNNTSSAYDGSHALYQDVVIPSLDTGPALAIETLTIAHEGYWL